MKRPVSEESILVPVKPCAVSARSFISVSTIAAVWLAILCTALAGCSKRATESVQPNPTPPPQPDLRAVEGYLEWGSFPIGAPARTQDARMAKRLRVSYDIESTVVVGTGALPALEMVVTNVIADYHVHFYVNDSLWWDVDARQRPIPQGWSGLFGLPWVPADTGTFVIRMVLDPLHQVPEVDENNNEQRLRVHVVPGDLVAGYIRFIHWENGYPNEVSSVKVGTPIQVIAESFARGKYPDHRAVLTACGDTLLDHRATLWGGTLWPDIRDDTLSFTPTAAGSCEIHWEVDPKGEFMMDSNRGDNVGSRILTVTP
jgi:hypothetical protein